MVLLAGVVAIPSLSFQWKNGLKIILTGRNDMVDFLRPVALISAITFLPLVSISLKPP